jgi:hypothetical protein
MKKAAMCTALALIALLALNAGTARAEVKSGFGLFGGYVNYNNSTTFKPGYGSGTFTYSSSGVSVGIDYQFAVSDSVSINPFLMSSRESSSVPGATASHGILGLGVRYWPSDVFVGAHIGNYSEVLTNSSGASSSATGLGAGFMVGWESKNGLMLLMQTDRATQSYTDSDVVLVAVRLQIGYRWK